MNRKSKLFFSLVSLCFSIAILCFGVYSALSVSYSVSGSVSYEVTDAFVEITTNVYASSERMEQSTLNSNAQNLEDPTYVNTYTKVGETYTYNSMEELSETNQPQASGIEINYNNYYTYFIVINIKNLSSDVNIYALIEEDIIGTELNSNVYKTRYQNGIIKPQTGDNVGKNIVLGFSLNDATIGVNAEFDYTLNVSTGDYEPQAAVIDVVALDNTNIVTNADFNGSSYTFDVTSSSPAHTTFVVQPVWLYNVYLQDIDYQSYNSLVVTVHTNEVIFGIGIAEGVVESVDDALSLASGASQNTDTHTSSLNVNANSQSLCFGIVTDNVYDIQSTVTITFANQLIDEENKLKFTQINNGTELSVSALDETISGVVTIPSTYNGLPVTQIESGGASSIKETHVDGFAYCDNITEIIIPETVKEIASYAFYYCESLETVTFGENSQLESIGAYAFSVCFSLTSMEIPSGVTSIGYSAVYNHLTGLGLEKVNITDIDAWAMIDFDNNYANPLYDGAGLYLNGELVTEVTLTTATKIADYAFYDYDSLTSITIPSSVTSIGGSAFRHCSALETVTFGENSQLESIGEYAFSNCSNLTSIEIPSSVTSIGSGAFFYCSALETVTFKDTTTEWTVSNGDTTNTITIQSPSTMATYLRSTYYNYTWTKKQSA